MNSAFDPLMRRLRIAEAFYFYDQSARISAKIKTTLLPGDDRIENGIKSEAKRLVRDELIRRLSTPY